MLNFEFHNPTKILFGKDQISKLSSEIPEKRKSTNGVWRRKHQKEWCL